MNERLFRTQFNQMENIEKQALMENLAARYDMTFLGLHTFERWCQSCTTGIFEKDGREFVFVPGDTVTLGWERFAVGLNQESREELEYLFREWEMEPQNPEEMIRESMAPVRQAAIGPMLVGRELEELCWEPVKMDDPRLTAHPDWLKEFRDFAWSDSSSLTLHQSARIERTEKGFQICIYNRTDYDALLAMLENRGFSLPTADEWAYLCGGGCRTLFSWGDGLDYSMRLHWFEDMDEDENRSYDMEEPNFFGLSIAYDPYMREVVQADRLTTCGGDGGCNICGGLGPFLGFLPCSPHCKPEVQEDNELNGDYVERKDSMTALWVKGDGFPKTEDNKAKNELLAALTPEQKGVLAEMLQDEHIAGIHDTLAYINKMMDLEGLELHQDGESYPNDYFESLHYDFISRCNGDEWPE